MIVDEADTFLRDNKELRGVLNSGHTKATAYTVRCVGDESEPRRFNTWGAKAIAAIGKLPETLADRSIEIRLRRALPDERVEKIRRAGSQGFERLARMAARWVADNADTLRRADPALPDGLTNRAGDNAEPLLAIADLAGGPWGERARRAVLRLSGLSDDGGSVGVQLLRDVLAVFVQRGVERLPTRDIVEVLAADELAPWRAFDHGRPITPSQLARNLGAYGIKPRNIRRGSVVIKGYERGDIEEQARRYLPKTAPEDPLHPLHALHEGHCEATPIRYTTECSGKSAAHTANENRGVASVADVAAISGPPDGIVPNADQVAGSSVCYRRAPVRNPSILIDHARQLQ